ncbi:MAG: MBL fold metallo-hydrolase [Betaproteobacteria bacterium]|nr:MBL fold metallo-hydrolase [Betaproteobacteria bacterium]
MISLGEFRIGRAVEHEGPFVRPEDFFPDWDPAVLEESRDWIGPVMDPASGQMILSFHAFVLRTARHTVVVDTCLGNDKERPLRPVGHQRKGDFLATLAAAGARPEEVDFVMCTHLHWDHVGWNTRLADGRWVPTFPNARYVMARREYEHMDALHARGDKRMHASAFVDSVQPIVRAERALLVDDDYQLEDGVWLEAMSGVSRRRFVEQHADTGNLVMPAHFCAPSAGRIVDRTKAFGFVSV